MKADTDTTEEELSKRRKRKGYSIARKVSKAYVKREARKREVPDISPLYARRAITGRGRIHLREEERGRGTLVFNGSLVVHLNETAVEYLRMIFEGEAEALIVKSITKRYKVKASIAKADLGTLLEDIKRLEQGKLPKRATRIDPLTGPYFAPFRADLALTYRTLSGKASDQGDELETEDWLKALDKIWTFGIPHVCLTGGEATVREDLVEIVDHSTSLGLMTGLLTDGERLGNKAFLGRLMDAGLEYVQVSIASHDEAVHSKVLGTPHHGKTVNGIKRAVKAGLPVMVNILLTTESEYGLEETVQFLVGLGVKAITVNSATTGEGALPDWMHQKALERARKASKGRARVFWFGPVPGQDPRKDREVESIGELAMGDLEWGSGRFHIFIHPDGSVTAGRGHGEVLGNVLTHNWNMLWYHTVLKEIRGKRLEGRRWKTLQELGFEGYPLFPNPSFSVEKD